MANKKVVIISIVLILSLFTSMFLVSAQVDEVETEKEIRAGITPKSFLYGLDVALDNLRYRLALSNESKARVGLEIAEERIAEIRELNEAKHIAIAEKNRERMMEKIGELQNLSEENKVRIRERLEEHVRVLEQTRLNFEDDDEATAELDEIIITTRNQKGRYV